MGPQRWTLPWLAAAGAVTVALASLVAALREQRRLAQALVTAERLGADRLRLLRLVVRLLAEPLFPPAPYADGQQVPSPPADGAYIFHELDCNLDSGAAGAAELVRRSGPRLRLLVFDVRNEELQNPIPNGFGAGPALLQRLKDFGVPQSAVEVAPWDHQKHGMIHTLIEAELAVRHAKAQGWRSLVVVAPPFHLPRAALTAASVAYREAPELRVLPFPGAPLPWEAQAVHSQGMVGTRLEFLDAELARIERYTAKGDIAPWDELEERFVVTPT